MQDSTTPRLWFAGHSRRQIVLMATLLFVGAVAFRLVAWGELRAWSVFFHGLPAVLAVAVAMAGPRRTLQGRVMFGVTLALLLAGTVAGEGFVCIVIGAPFAYLVAWGVATSMRLRRLEGPQALLLPALLLVSFTSGLGAGTDSVVTATTHSPASAAAVSAMMAVTPEIPPVASGLLSFGFPQPASVDGDGLDVGDVRRVTFSDGGVLELTVAASSPGRAVFEATSDTTAIGDWITWRTATFTWAEASGGTEVALDLSYRRHLQPGWYFGPIVRAGVGQAAEHLLASIVR